MCLPDFRPNALSMSRSKVKVMVHYETQRSVSKFNVSGQLVTSGVRSTTQRLFFFFITPPEMTVEQNAGTIVILSSSRIEWYTFCLVKIKETVEPEVKFRSKQPLRPQVMDWARDSLYLVTTKLHISTRLIYLLSVSDVGGYVWYIVFVPIQVEKKLHISHFGISLPAQRCLSRLSVPIW